MEIVFSGIIGAVVFFIILYFVVKEAVRNALAESQGVDGTKPFADGAISQKECLNCGEAYDVDYPKCPHCKHLEEQ